MGTADATVASLGESLIAGIPEHLRVREIRYEAPEGLVRTMRAK